MASKFDQLLTRQRRCVACKQWKDSEQFRGPKDRTCGPCLSIIKEAKDKEQERKERDRKSQVRRVGS